MKNYYFINRFDAKRLKFSKLLRLAFGLGISGAAIAAAHAEKDESGDDEMAVVTLDAVILKGEKQDRSLKNTVSSVSVVDEKQLLSMQSLTVREAIEGAPNVLALDGVVPNVRGVQGNGAAGGFYGVSGGANARVSMLVDGVADPFLAVFAGDSGLWDLEQVEVYRGPQSTNNGKNSVAGAMYLKTYDPTFYSEGKVRVGYRDQEGYLDTAVMLSGPLIDDTLAFRFTGQMIDGQTLTANEEYEDNPAHYDLNEMKSKTARFKMLWTPSENFEAMLTYSTGKEEGDLARRYYSNETDYIAPYPQDQRVENDTLSLNLGYTFSDSVSLDVLVSTKDYTYGYDSYAATEAQEQQVILVEEGTTFDAKLNFGEGDQALFGHIGLAYFDRDQSIVSYGSFVYDGGDSSDSQAIYGEVNYAFTEKLTLTGGMRYQEESQSRYFNFPIYSLNMELDVDEDVFLPSVALQYDLTEDTRLAFSARKGYNSAGGAVHPLIGIPFYYDKEEVDTYELSSRTNLAEGAVTLRANLFYNDYAGYQASNGLSIANLEDVKTYGAEFEATVWASKDLQLNFGLGLLDTEIKDGGAVTGVDGNELNYAPKTTFSTAATYYVNESLDLGASLVYKGKYFGDLANTEETEIDGHTILNLNANYKSGAWLFSAFINNVADKSGVLNHFNYGTARYTVEIIQPRTLGGSVTYSF